MVSILKNYGNGPALNISCSFDPDIIYQDSGAKLSELNIFKNLHFLGPKDDFKFFFDAIYEYLKDETKPISITVTIKYKDVFDRIWEDSFLLDFKITEKLLFTSEKDLNDIAKELEKIRKELNYLNDNLKK